MINDIYNHEIRYHLKEPKHSCPGAPFICDDEDNYYVLGVCLSVSLSRAPRKKMRVSTVLCMAPRGHRGGRTIPQRRAAGTWAVSNVSACREVRGNHPGKREERGTEGTHADAQCRPE